MVIGSVLLQPQRLQRVSQRAAEEAILDDLISLLVYLLIDGVEDGRVTQTMGASVAGTVERLTAQAGAGANSAVTRLMTLFDPLIAPIQALGEPSENPLDALLGAEHGVETVVNLLKGLSAPAIRQHTSEFFDILATDLGITPTFVSDLLAGLFDDMVAALGVARDGETDEQKANRQAVAGLLRRISRSLMQHFTFPVINADSAAQALIDLILRPEISEVLERVACASDALSAYFHVGDALIEAIPYSASETFGGGGMGAAAAPDARTEIAFYGSKLLEYDNSDGDLGKLPPNTTLEDGPVSQALRDAFRPLSAVLANFSFIYTVEEGNEWRIIDRKKYVISHIASTVAIYRYFEISEGDLTASGADEIDKLKKLFHENGFPLSTETTIQHESGSNLWTIYDGATVWNALKEDGTITVRPTTRAYILFELPGDLQPADDAKVPTDALRDAFAAQGILLTPRATLAVRNPGQDWLLDDGEFEYKVERDKQELNVSIGSFFGWLRANIIKKPKGDVVWVNKERTQVLLGQRILHAGTDVAWSNAPIFSNTNTGRHYSFHGDPNSTEQLAYHISWIQDALHVLVDIAKIPLTKPDQRKYMLTSNSLDAGRLLSDMIVKLAARRPMSEQVGSPWAYDLVVDAGLLVAKLIETVIKTVSEPSEPPPPGVNGFSKFVDTALGVALGVDLADTYWTEAACEFILSLFTLINHVEPPVPAAGAQPTQQRPDNYKESGGFIDLFWILGLLVYTGVIPESEYAYPFQTVPLTGGFWPASLGVGLIMGFAGYLTAQGIAGMGPFEDGGQLAKTLAKTGGKSMAYFWSFLKLTHRHTEQFEALK